MELTIWRNQIKKLPLLSLNAKLEIFKRLYLNIMALAALTPLVTLERVMRNLVSNVGRKLFRNESGAALLEYSVLLGVILVVAIGSMIFAGDWVSQRWGDLQAQLETVPADGTAPAPAPAPAPTP